MVTKFNSPLGRLFVMLILFLTTVAASAQRQVTGLITGEDNDPLVGASVVVKGTNTGVVTDVDGKFSIAVTGDNAVLVVSYVGQKTQEVSVGAQSDISIQMSSASLEEVIVTGYSVDKRKQSTGAVSIVKSKDLTTVPSSSVEQQLQGRVAGLTVVTGSQPGSGSQIRIRGFGAFGGNDPLIIVDGYPVGNVNFLNPEDIETTTVLKDASTASIYGARAANGVIVYTTKRGKKGAKKLNVTYDGIYGVTDPGTGQKMMNPQDQATWTWNAYRNSGIKLSHPQYGTGEKPVIPDYLKVGNQSGVVGTVDLAAEQKKYNVKGPTIGDFYQVIKANKEGTDWYAALTQAAPIQRHTLGFEGGGDASRFYVGISAQDQQGILASQRASRYGLRINTEFDVFKNVRIGENLQMTYLSILGRDGGNNGLGTSQQENDILNAFRSPTIIPVYDEFGGYAGSTALGFGQGSNPVANQQRRKANKGFDALASGNFYIEIDPIKDLTFRSSIGGNYVNYHGYGYGFPIYETLENKGVDYSYSEYGGYGLGWTLTNTLSYKKQFGIHGVELLVGQEALNTGFGKGLDANGTKPFSGDPNYITISTLDTRNPPNSFINIGSTFNSYFGRAIYNMNDKYILTGVLRRDGSSKFGSNTRYGIFPAISAAWRLSAEPFMKNLSWISDLKIRGGYGEMGNSNNVFQENQYDLFASNVSNSAYDIGGTNAGVTNGFKQSRIGNKNAKWETSATKNIGFDGSFFKGKLDIIFDLWQKDTRDLLNELDFVAPAGTAATPSQNVGTMVNKGIDIQVITKGNFTSDLKYEFDVTGSFLKNEITEIGGGLTYLTRENPGFRDVQPIRNQVGYSVSSFYGLKVLGLFQNAAEVKSAPAQEGAAIGRFKFADINGRDSVTKKLTGKPDGKVDSDDRTYLGSPVPSFTGGLNFKISYKNFDVAAYFYTSIGNKIFNVSKRFTDFYPLFPGSAISERVKESWTPQNTGAKIPIFEDYNGPSSSKTSSDFYVEDGSYLRFQNLSIGYNLPTGVTNKLRLGRVRVHGSVNNLFTITGYGGLDPQVAGAADTNFGIDLGNFPVTRQFTFGLNIGF
jgi:TonB-dependent starch-binding outer membrane protein SusC